MTLSHGGRRWLLPLLDLRDAKSEKEIVDAIARARNIDGIEESEWNFPECGKAIERLQRVIASGERVGIFGDYDCDGITSTALLVRALLRRKARPVVRLPHRAQEGYGMKMKHVDEFAKLGVTLLFTVDTGIGCAKEIASAKERGIDTIILDHHHVPEDPAKPFAVLHPLLSPGWKGTMPSAAGVTWSFVRALEQAENTGWPGQTEDTVLGALGTIADLVELRGGNRTLVQEGLHALSKITSGPLATLATSANVTSISTARDWAFRLAPRINAAGRMDDPMIGLKAILGDASSLQELERLNSERQEVVREHWDEIDVPQVSASNFLFLTSSEYTPGIVGLIAGKLSERFGKPSLVGSLQGDTITASLRSIPGYHVTEALGRAQKLLMTFGGHAQAAGCTFAASRLEELRTVLNADISSRFSGEDLVPLLSIDALLRAEQLTKELAIALQELEPHGQGNDKPRFVIEGARLEELRTMGADNSHLQARVGTVRLVGFGHGSLAEKLNQGASDVTGYLTLHTWKDRTEPQFFLEDVRWGPKNSHSSLQTAQKLPVQNSNN